MSCATVLLLLLLRHPLSSSANAVEVWQRNLANIDADTFHVRKAAFTNDFIFSFVGAHGFGNSSSNGTLQNFRVEDTQNLDGAFDLGERDPVDMSFVDNNLAVSFGEPNRLLVWKNLQTKIYADLPYQGDAPILAGEVHLQPGSSYVVVFEYEDVDPPYPDAAEMNLHVYSFQGQSLAKTSTITPKDGFGAVVSGFPPSGAFHPGNSSRFFAIDGDKLVYLIGIDSQGKASVEDTFDHPNTDIHIRSIEASHDGQWLAMTSGGKVSLVQTASMTFAYDSQSLWTIVSSLCWSPDDRFLVVGTVSQNTLIIDVANDRNVYWNDTLPGSEFESFFCDFSPVSGLFVMDSYKVPLRERPPEFNLTTYRIPNYSPIPGASGSPAPTLPATPNVVATQSPAPVDPARACFPGSATVERWPGEKVNIHELQLGDVVRTGPTTFSGVYLWGHFDSRLRTKFIIIEYKDQATNKSGLFSASPTHYVETPDGLVTAGELDVGGSLVDGTLGTLVEVTRISASYQTGLYNPHTLDGNIVVDGVQVSTYTAVISPRLAHAILWPLRTLSRILPKCLWGRFARWVDEGIQLLPSPTNSRLLLAS